MTQAIEPAGNPPAAKGRTAAATRREYLAVLALAAAGAGLVLFSLRQGWARVAAGGPAPLPAVTVSVSGQSLVPLAGALGVASAAGLAAVIATRGPARRLVGLLLGVFGLAMLMGMAAPPDSAAVHAAARTATVSQAGSATAGGQGLAGAVGGGATPGVSSAGRVTQTGLPWRPLALTGAVMVAAAGILTAWRGARWPAMSGRYDRPAGTARGRGAGPASAWEALNAGIDPTEQADAGREAPGPPLTPPSAKPLGS